jgi:peptide/nickel transport system permease protein
MWGFVARRATQAVAIVFLVATATFFLIHAAPGDPFAETLENPLIPEQTRVLWRRMYGLDRPLPEQYARYVLMVARGDLGYSWSMHRPVRDALAAALPNTLLLMSLALAASFALGIAVGVAQARRRGSLTDRALGAGSLVFFSMPDFWLGLSMMMVFAYWFGLFPTGGIYDQVSYEYLSPVGKLLNRAWHLVLPVATLTLITSAVVARYQRAAILEAAQQDYVRTARAKGLDERRVLRRHVLRNALIPVVTLLGLAFPALLGGSVFVEQVFSWPGMGYLTLGAIAKRDYHLVTASVIIGSVMVAVGSFLADVLYAVVDPRLRSD